MASPTRKRELVRDAQDFIRPKIGYWVGRNGKKTPHRFNLGRDKQEAERRYLAIKKLYEDDLKSPDPLRADPSCWSPAGLAYAKQIASGSVAVQVPPPSAVDPRGVVEYQQGLEHDMRRWPSATIVPSDPMAYEESARQNQEVVNAELATLNARLTRAGILPTGASPIQRVAGVTVGQALEGFKEYLKSLPKYTNPNGGRSAWGKTRLDQCKSLEFYLSKWLLLDLGQIGKVECDAVIDHIANRPRTQRKSGHLKPKSAKHFVWMTRKFFEWMDESDIPWELPPKFRPDKRVQYRSLDVSEIQQDEITTIPLGDLKFLISHATELEKLYIGLALNCAYGADQLGRLQIEWLDLENQKVKGARVKRATASRHYYWACNVARLREHIGDRTKGTVFINEAGEPIYRISENGNSLDGITRAWEQRLYPRIRKFKPEFPRYSFGKLRKTAATLVLEKADPHIASMLLGHKTISDDELLTAYAKLPWEKLYEHQRELESLAKEIGL